MDNGIYDLVQQLMQHPEMQMAYQGIAGKTAPAQAAMSLQSPATAAPTLPVPANPEKYAVPSYPGMSSPDSRIAGAFSGLPQQDYVPNAPDFSDVRLPQGQPQQAPLPYVSTGREGAPAGPVGMLGGYGGILADALSALSADTSRLPPMTAFGQGFAGAMASGQNRQDRKRNEQLREEELGWKREDRAHDRAREGVADERYEHAQKLEDAKARRDEIHDRLAEISGALGNDRAALDLDKATRDYFRAGLSIDDLDKIEGQVNDYGEIISPKNSMRPMEPDKLNKLLDEHRNQLIKQRKAMLGIESGGENVVPQGAAQSPETPIPVSPQAVAPQAEEAVSAPDLPEANLKPNGLGLSSTDPMIGADEGKIYGTFQQNGGAPVYFIDENGKPRKYTGK